MNRCQYGTCRKRRACCTFVPHSAVTWPIFRRSLLSYMQVSFVTYVGLFCHICRSLLSHVQVLLSVLDLSLSLSRALSLWLSLARAHARVLSPSHTHTHIHIHTYALHTLMSRTHKQSHWRSSKCAIECVLSLQNVFSYYRMSLMSRTHKHVRQSAHGVRITHTHTHTQTHTNTHTHTHTHTQLSTTIPRPTPNRYQKRDKLSTRQKCSAFYHTQVTYAELRIHLYYYLTTSFFKTIHLYYYPIHLYYYPYNSHTQNCVCFVHTEYVFYAQS